MPDDRLPGGRKTSTSPRNTSPSNNGRLLTPSPATKAAMAMKLGAWWAGDWREGTGEYGKQAQNGGEKLRESMETGPERSEKLPFIYDGLAPGHARYGWWTGAWQAGQI
jgi:hypothetical protein